MVEKPRGNLDDLERRLNSLDRPGSMVRYYDRAGKPIGLGTWARLQEDHSYHVVNHTRLPNNYFVSTIWLGLDHGLGAGPPVIFETVVFRRRSSQEIEYRRMRAQQALRDAREELDILGARLMLRSAGVNESVESERHHTEAEALAGHERIVETWKQKGLLAVIPGGKKQEA